MNKKIVSYIKNFSIAASMLFLTACASTGALDERDPWEGFNRGVYSFNETMDNVIFDPVSKVYDFITPDPIDNGISNFFSNLGQISVIANNILQLKFDQAVNDTVRFLFNSTLGLFGFFDIFGSALPSSEEDFGQTLAHWGVESGPYLVVPFFGPATVRDAAGFAIDGIALNPVGYLDDDLTRAGLMSLNFIDIKSYLLSAVDLIGDAAVDEYEFIKNAYFERRASQLGDNAFEDFPEE